jgi:hypothetical protein
MSYKFRQKEKKYASVLHNKITKLGTILTPNAGRSDTVIVEQLQ